MGAIVFGVLWLAALATSAVSGVLGMAGGMALLGVMTALLPAAQVVPVHGVVQMSSNLTRTWAFRRQVDWRLFAVYAPPGIAGAGLGAWLWAGSELVWFKPAIGAFILAFLVWRRYSPQLRALPLWTYAPLGLAIGFLAVFVGATGPLIAPFFFREDRDKQQIIATKAVCQTWMHLLKIPAFLALGFDYRPHLWLMAALLAAVVAGTYAGKGALERMDESTFATLFQLVLGGIAAYLLVTGVWGWLG